MAFNKHLAESYDSYVSTHEDVKTSRGYKRARKISHLNLKWLINQTHRTDAIVEEIAKQVLYIDPRGTASFKLRRDPE